MKKRVKGTGALLLVFVMVAFWFMGCDHKEIKTDTTSGDAEVVTEETTSGSTYPIDTDVTLTYWMELNSNVAANYNNMADTPFGRNLTRQTGVNIEYIHPAAGQVAEAFNLLLAEKVLPDIIENNWLDYSGGPEKAIKDGIIIPLNDVIEQYCPNLKAYLETHPEIDAMVKTDDGTYYCFPFIRGGDALLTSTGLVLREDWLEELHLEIPETIEEWEVVLTAFKEEKNAAAPFTFQYSLEDFMNNNPWEYAYGVSRNFYLDDSGKIVYGAVQDGYKEYLQLMNKWMKQGLIDVDLLTLTGEQVAAKLTNGSAGASFGYCGSGMGNWINAGKAKDENYNLVAAPYPTLDKGTKPEMGQRDNNYIGIGSAAISTSCENIELAARLLDYAYSEEGHILYNFGEEGTSYELRNEEPNYTGLLLDNPDGISVTHAMGGYIRANYNGPFVQDEAYVEQYYTLDNQKDAVKIWAETNMEKHIIPPITPTAEESQEQSQIMYDINTYRDEYTIKFIFGTIDFSEWDTYVDTIYKMGLDRVLEIQNDALDRYYAR
mgnify:CR=1 FL=1